jgi:hypothetical protein
LGNNALVDQHSNFKWIILLARRVLLDKEVGDLLLTMGPDYRVNPFLFVVNAQSFVSLLFEELCCLFDRYREFLH